MIEGRVILKAKHPPASASGTVRLEDVSFADLPSRTVAEQPIRADARASVIPFALQVADGLDPRRSYIVTAELCVRDRRHGPPSLFGVKSAYPWNPRESPRRLDIEVETLGQEERSNER